MCVCVCVCVCVCECVITYMICKNRHFLYLIISGVNFYVGDLLFIYWTPPFKMYLTAMYNYGGSHRISIQ